MVQLKGELYYLEKNQVKISKNVEFTAFFNVKKTEDTAKSLLFRI